MADEMIEDKNAKTYFKPDETQPEMSEDERERNANEALALVIPGYQPTHIKRDDEIDWANGGKTVVDHRKPAPTSTPTATPAPTPAQPSLENGDTIVKDGRGVTQFGSKIRVVDQKTGATRWTDLNGNPIDKPKSEQMRHMMMNGHTSLGVQAAGFKKPFDVADDWDAAIAAQKSGKQAEALAKSKAYGARLLEQQTYDNEQSKKRLTNRRLAAGDAFGAALAGLNGEITRSEDGKIIGRDGKPADSRVRVSADGKHIYLMSSVSHAALKMANDQRRKNGGASDYNSIIAYREIDVNGNPLKDRNGNDIPPMIAVRDTPGGQSGTDVKQRFRTMSLRDVADKLLQAHSDAGHGDGDTIKTATIEQLGGWDPNGWGRTLKPKQTGSASAEAATIRAASAEKIQQMKGNQALEQIAANNNGKIDLAKLTGEQKQKLLDSANELKKYGIDIGLQIAQENNASKEKIAAQTEAGRNARFTMRNDREWEKLAQGWEKIDNDFAVKMRRADTYGKRIDILEQKLKNDYDIALKKAKTADERAKVEADYKDRMASVAEGNFDLNWFKAETAADQGQQKLDNDKAAKEEDRKLKMTLAGIRVGAKTSNGTVVGADDMKTAKYYIQLLNSSRLTGENRAKVKEWLNSRGLLGIDNQTTIKPGDNSGSSIPADVTLDQLKAEREKRRKAAGAK